MFVLEGLVGLHRTGQLQFLWHQWLGHGLGSPSTRKGTQCGGKKKKNLRKLRYVFSIKEDVRNVKVLKRVMPD